MTELEAIKARHSVRKYTSQPIEESKLNLLREEIQKCNSEAGIHIQLVVDEPKAFSTGVFKYGVFSGVRNYLVMAGKKDAEERIGYYGERIVLLAQTLGLNTCWVGLTYKKIPGTYTLEEMVLGRFGSRPAGPHCREPAEVQIHSAGRKQGAG